MSRPGSFSKISVAVKSRKSSRILLASLSSFGFVRKRALLRLTISMKSCLVSLLSAFPALFFFDMVSVVLLLTGGVVLVVLLCWLFCCCCCCLEFVDES